MGWIKPVEHVTQHSLRAAGAPPDCYLSCVLRLLQPLRVPPSYLTLPYLDNINKDRRLPPEAGELWMLFPVFHSSVGLTWPKWLGALTQCFFIAQTPLILIGLRAKFMASVLPSSHAHTSQMVFDHFGGAPWPHHNIWSLGPQTFAGASSFPLLTPILWLLLLSLSPLRLTLARSPGLALPGLFSPLGSQSKAQLFFCCSHCKRHIPLQSHAKVPGCVLHSAHSGLPEACTIPALSSLGHALHDVPLEPVQDTYHLWCPLWAVWDPCCMQPPQLLWGGCYMEHRTQIGPTWLEQVPHALDLALEGVGGKTRVRPMSQIQHAGHSPVIWSVGWHPGL